MSAQWKVTGSYFEACNCSTMCPCALALPPTEGECNALIGWHIDKGTFSGVQLDGLNAALFGHTPGHMLQTKWQVVLYLDQKANDEQRDALTKIFSGQAGGHLAVLAPLIGAVLGVESVAIEYRADGKHRALTIPQVGHMEIEALAGQNGQEVTVSNAPFGPVPNYPSVVCQSKQLSYHAHGFNVEVSEKNGFYSPFSYQA